MTKEEMLAALNGLTTREEAKAFAQAQAALTPEEIDLFLRTTCKSQNIGLFVAQKEFAQLLYKMTAAGWYKADMEKDK